MKPVHIGLLVAAGAIVGGLVMKWQSPSPQPAPAPVAATAPATAPTTPVNPEPVAATPAEPVKPAAESRPSPFSGGKKETPRQSRRKTEPPAPAPAVTPTPPAQTSTPEPPKETRNEPERALLFPPPQPPPPPPQKVTLTPGTMLQARLVDGLSSDRNVPGDTFNATLDAPLIVEGLVLAERGARLEGRVVESQKAGRVQGVSQIEIELTKLTTADGQHIAIQTDPWKKLGEKTVGQDAAKVGAATGIGAAIGAIAGGGRGAGIGAAVGAATGAGGVMATRGKPVAVPSETRISFRLRTPVTITERK